MPCTSSWFIAFMTVSTWSRTFFSRCPGADFVHGVLQRLHFGLGVLLQVRHLPERTGYAMATEVLPGFWAALHFIYLLDLLDLLDLLGYLCYLIYLIYLDILRFIPSNFWDELLFHARQRFALLLHLCLVETPDFGVGNPWAFLVGKSSTNVGFPPSSIMIYINSLKES